MFLELYEYGKFIQIFNHKHRLHFRYEYLDINSVCILRSKFEEN